MREYFVGDDFFKENNIPKQNYAVCRIKKHTRGKKVDDDDAVNMEEDMLWKQSKVCWLNLMLPTAQHKKLWSRLVSGTLSSMRHVMNM
ncbi:hypothetical protein FXO38_28027 [Capsicum annuum]|uniref:Uncharacterized protein n=1 Tax=Capsicum annuum TaxID=4072 RepID=A0A2G2ZCY5_CAPAN|nr:hypothetical protein FXO38_28027 [Capsicum annuum]KAF3636998.1 hypothetical protein FXO37_25141 [Capsicum annuum]PHT79735.1 hypothetical protein T459_17787 [Capsicum annuum]